MEEVASKKSTTLSVDRAAFLLLRVKKAFKKKRHLRKEKPSQLTSATLATHSRSCRKVPPPLLRSRTLPAIVVPGIPVVTLNLDSHFSQIDDHVATKSSTNKWCTHAKTPTKPTTRKSLMLPNDDISLVYRRKSSDSNHSQQKLYDVSGIQTCDGLECHPDGSVVLRIPAPHVVAARAYRLSSTKQSQAETNTQQLIIPPHEGSSIAASNCCTHAYAGSSSTSSTALTRFVKLLQTTSTKASHSDNMFLALKTANSNEAPRRLSWERRKDSSALQRSASIDSVAEAVWSDTPRPSLDLPRHAVAPFNKRPSASSLFSNCSTSSQNTQLNINYNDGISNTSIGSSRRESMLSPSSTRRNKMSRIINDNVLSNTLNVPTQRIDHVSAEEYNVDTVVLRPTLHRHYYTDNSYYHKEAHHRSPKSHDRWSEQLTNLIPIARPLRTVNSCTPKVFKEMEFLIPHVSVSELAPTISSAGSHKLPSSSLSISRQSRVPCYSTNMSHPKNAKLQKNTDPEDASSDENVLSVSRQPMTSSARSKSGNTPHRNKMSKKQLKLAQAQLDKFTQINVHLHALFSAVEHGHLDKARTILESTDLDVNSINSDGLSALDVAVLSNNRSMTKMLLQHGALGGSQFSSDSIGTKLNALLKDAESRIHDLSGSSDGTCQPSFGARPSISSIIIGNTSSSVTGCTGNETDKQIGIWERRVKGIRRLLLGWDQTRPPDAPASVTVDVTGVNSITVQVLEPFDGAIGTKFKVQWSTRADFGNIVGEREIMDWATSHGTMGSQCHINGLTQGRRYFIRAMCGNVKGWGPVKTSVPACVVPSSWRDVNNHEDRYLGRQRLLDNLFTAVRLARPADVSELTLDSSTAQRRNPKKKTTIKQLFSVASRFQKNLRRGIYLASTIYCEDKVLVTSEDFLPVIEIDEAYPGTLHSDYHWLMKVACSWEDVKSLRSDMERNLTSAVHFRTKLLSAVCQMQSALGLIDLGTLYYKTFRDSHGTVVLTCVQAVRSQKSVSILNSRWLPVNKLQKKIVAIHEDYTISEMLISSIGDQIHYHQASMKRLEPGLYLGYLKMQCSVEQIQVVVPVKTPNVLPHCKVRENSHINAEEWQVLKPNCNHIKEGCVSSQRIALDFNANSAESTTEVQRLFLYDLATAAQKLLAYMNIRLEDAATHRLYDVEIIEHSKDISVLVICPSVELTCAAPGQPEILLQRDDLVSLSIQAFEMIHLRTYQSGIIQKYSRLSCILELDTALANHSHREAFSTSELQTAKERLAKLHELTANLNTIWKCVRWLMDVIAFARDKNALPSVAMHEILEFAQTSEEHHSTSGEQKDLLQLPLRDVKFNKSGSGRGSWPGPAGSTHSTSLVAEHSKSEQNLDRTIITPNAVTPNSEQPSEQTSLATDSAQLLNVGKDYKHSDVSLRKNSGDSVTSEYTTHSFYSGAESAVFHAIPPSRSADILTLSTSGIVKSQQTSAMNRKRTSSNTTSRNSQPPPSISVSNSVPHLASKSTTTTSTLSLKTVLTTDFDVTNKQMETRNPSSEKTKAASSINLRDGGLYLRSTLSALQTEMKTNTDEGQNVKSSSTKSLSHQSSEEDSASGSSLASEQGSGIIQVYTAYNTGLASGTSLKLHVTPKTSAREVINLVVKQLNMAAVLKGNNGPIYTSEMLDNFCLVAVIGARERCLRDDFKPLQLQNPWKKGRLYVRQKHELLAAIEHSNKKSQLI